MPIETRSKKQKKENNTESNCLNEMPHDLRCKNNDSYCMLGQSCIVDRRWLGDFVHEDLVFDSKNIPRRINCYQPFTIEQEAALDEAMRGFTERSIYDRWNDDSNM